MDNNAPENKAPAPATTQPFIDKAKMLEMLQGAKKSPLVLAIETRIGIIEREIIRTIELVKHFGAADKAHVTYLDELRGALGDEIEAHQKAHEEKTVSVA